jgi:hypothetical protein
MGYEILVKEFAGLIYELPRYESNLHKDAFSTDSKDERRGVDDVTITRQVTYRTGNSEMSLLILSYTSSTCIP